MPAEMRYTYLTSTLGDEISLHTKDLEVYAGDEPPPPGDYRLRSSGEIVVKPDLLSEVTIALPLGSSKWVFVSSARLEHFGKLLGLAKSDQVTAGNLLYRYCQALRDDPALQLDGEESIVAGLYEPGRNLRPCLQRPGLAEESVEAHHRLSPGHRLGDHLGRDVMEEGFHRIEFAGQGYTKPLVVVPSRLVLSGLRPPLAG
jgi:hypothetical protein